jgi:hypothetical protein
MPAIETGDGAFAVPGPGGDGWVELRTLCPSSDDLRQFGF